MKITKGNNSEEAAIKKASFLSSLVDEKTDKEIKVECLIREQYSISQEIMLHRKKLMGVLPEEEWGAYIAFVEECIAKADEENTDGGNE